MYPHVHDEDLGILGEFFNISQTERRSEFGRYGLVYKKSREIPAGYCYEWNSQKEKVSQYILI